MKGYLDRIVDNQYAVILVEKINREFVIKKEMLPKGSAVKSYFDLTIENGQITKIKVNKQATDSAKEEAENLQTILRSRSRSSK